MPFVIDEGLKAGLRPLDEQERNSQPLALLQNLVPTEHRLKRPPTVGAPPIEEAESTVWPHPRFIRDNRNVLFAGLTEIHHINDSTLATETSATASTTLTSRISTAKSYTISQAGESAWQLRCGQILGETAYITDMENELVQVRRLDGELILSFGTAGSGNGQFTNPWDVKIYDNEIYVADGSNYRIQVFDMAGNFVRTFGTQGTGSGQFEGVPIAIAVNENGVYVEELVTKKISRWQHDGTYVTRRTSSYTGHIRLLDGTLYRLVKTGTGPDTYGINTITFDLGTENTDAITLPVVGTWNTYDFDLNAEFYFCNYLVTTTTTLYVIPRATPASLVATSITGSSSHAIRCCVSQNAIISIEESTATMKVWTINPVHWQLAGFTDNIWFATNGRSLLYRLPSNASVAADEETTVRFSAIASHHGALVVGGVSGTLPSVWDEYFEIWRKTYQGRLALGDDLEFDTSFIVVSEPGGGFEDKPYIDLLSLWEVVGTGIGGAIDPLIRSHIEQGKIMIHRMATRGTVQVIKSLGQDLMVYTTTGVSRLEFTERGIIETPLLFVGVPSRAGVAGTEQEHVFLTAAGDLYRMRLGEGLQQLHYSEYLRDLVQGVVVISYDPVERYYTIADGVHCYWLTRTGLGNSQAKQVLSMVRLTGYRGLAGTVYAPTLQQAARVITDIFDGGEKGVLEVELVRIATTDLSSGWQVRAWARLEKSSSWYTEGWITFDDRGVGRVKVTGIDFYLELEADDYTAVDLNRIEIDIRANGRKSLATILANV
jgi:hypothetical protein